jgi:hypothetical protein
MLVRWDHSYKGKAEAVLFKIPAPTAFLGLLDQLSIIFYIKGECQVTTIMTTMVTAMAMVTTNMIIPMI